MSSMSGVGGGGAMMVPQSGGMAPSVIPTAGVGGPSDISPLPQHIARGLNDRLYEKRKQAALEIEKLIREFVADPSGLGKKKIGDIITILSTDFLQASNNPHTRKGGLIGLAATAIALGFKEVQVHLSSLINPVCDCFSDPDTRVRYYACEALFNISKVARGHIMLYVTKIFDGLSRLAADPDANVRSGTELLDKLMQDTVAEHVKEFDVATFIPQLTNKMRSTEPKCEYFLVKWIVALNSRPNTHLVYYLPELLDGLFTFLGTDDEVLYHATRQCLMEFLQEIRREPEVVKFSEMVNILVYHSTQKQVKVQTEAVMWIKEFVVIARRQMLPFLSNLLLAILPCFSLEGEQYSELKEYASKVNNALQDLITEADDNAPQQSLTFTGNSLMDEDFHHDFQRLEVGDRALDVKPVVDALSKLIGKEKVPTQIQALSWLLKLYPTVPHKMFICTENIFPTLLDLLKSKQTQPTVNQLVMRVLAEIASSAAAPRDHDVITCPSQHNAYFRRLLKMIVDMFPRLINDERGTFIIKNLCSLLPARDVYRTLSEILYSRAGEDRIFVASMVQMLNAILMTTSELYNLRSELQTGFTHPDSKELFCCIYRSWCFCPVATVSLCLLARKYKHTCRLLHLFASLEIDVDLLNEVDKLVQLLESPIFANLRLQMLDSGSGENAYLIKAMYSLLMLLPQSAAFNQLRNRLACVPPPQLIPDQAAVVSKPAAASNKLPNHISPTPICNGSEAGDPTEGDSGAELGSEDQEIDSESLLQQFKSVNLGCRSRLLYSSASQSSGGRYHTQSPLLTPGGGGTESISSTSTNV